MADENPEVRGSILHLGKYFRPHQGGMETALRQISEAGIRLGYTVNLWVTRDQRSESAFVTYDEVKVRRFLALGRLWSTPLSLGIFFSRLPPSNFIHVHLPHPLAEIRTLFLVKSSARKMIPYLHAFPVSQGRLGRVWFKFVTRKILDHASTILISNEGLKSLVPGLRDYSHKIRVVPFSTLSISEDERARLYSTRETRKTIVTVGRMVSYKGYDLLLRAWKTIVDEAEEFREWKLVLAGGGPDLSALRKWSAENIPKNRVSLLGECTDETKEKLLKESTLFVMSSTTTAETFGISLLEAFGAGLPAVVSDLPGGVGILGRGGECGEIFNPNSLPDLVRALRSILASPEKRSETGKANLRLAHESYSMENSTEAYAEVLK